MNQEELKILIYGYGNPGRQDDGLGPIVADLIEKENFSNVKIDSNYQLNAEDAVALADSDITVFVDASEDEKVETFNFFEVKPDDEIGYTTHAMSAGSVLALCNTVYKKHPATYMLGIRGVEWGFKEELSQRGRQNLELAVSFLKDLLKNPSKERFQKALKPK